MMRNAFTLIELIIVVAISALLSTLAITYSSVGRNSVSLSVEASKISQFILQAKQLSIATYTSSSGSCGYGVVLDPVAQTYSIFAYDPTGIASCHALTPADILTRGIDASQEEQIYTTGTWGVHLSAGVKIQSQGDSLVTVLFFPPTPSVFLSTDGAIFENPATDLTVHLITVDGQNGINIGVNPEGQVSI